MIKIDCNFQFILFNKYMRLLGYPFYLIKIIKKKHNKKYYNIYVLLREYSPREYLNPTSTLVCQGTHAISFSLGVYLIFII